MGAKQNHIDPCGKLGTRKRNTECECERQRVAEGVHEACGAEPILPSVFAFLILLPSSHDLGFATAQRDSVSFQRSAERLGLGLSEPKARRFRVSRGERGEGALRKPP